MLKYRYGDSSWRSSRDHQIYSPCSIRAALDNTSRSSHGSVHGLNYGSVADRLLFRNNINTSAQISSTTATTSTSHMNNNVPSFNSTANWRRHIQNESFQRSYWRTQIGQSSTEDHIDLLQKKFHEKGTDHDRDKDQVNTSLKNTTEGSQLSIQEGQRNLKRKDFDSEYNDLDLNLSLKITPKENDVGLDKGLLGKGEVDMSNSTSLSLSLFPSSSSKLIRGSSGIMNRKHHGRLMAASTLDLTL